jgi:hypothetical protein
MSLVSTVREFATSMRRRSSVPRSNEGPPATPLNEFGIRFPELVSGIFVSGGKQTDKDEP